MIITCIVAYYLIGSIITFFVFKQEFLEAQTPDDYCSLAFLFLLFSAIIPIFAVIATPLFLLGSLLKSLAKKLQKGAGMIIAAIVTYLIGLVIAFYWFKNMFVEADSNPDYIVAVYLLLTFAIFTPIIAIIFCPFLYIGKLLQKLALKKKPIKKSSFVGDALRTNGALW